MTPHEINIQTYHALAEAYEQKFMHLDLYNDTYDVLCNVLADDAQVLEVGCGPGNITRYLLNKKPGLRWLATDPAPAMLQRAAHNNPTAHCRLMAAQDIHTLEQDFDAIVSGFCLPYLPGEHTRGFIRNCARLLRPQAWLYISFIEGEESRSGWETGSTGLKAFVFYYNTDLIRDLLQQQGFDIPHVFHKQYGQGAKANVHTILLAQKTGKKV